MPFSCSSAESLKSAYEFVAGVRQFHKHLPLQRSAMSKEIHSRTWDQEIYSQTSVSLNLRQGKAAYMSAFKAELKVSKELKTHSLLASLRHLPPHWQIDPPTKPSEWPIILSTSLACATTRVEVVRCYTLQALLTIRVAILAPTKQLLNKTCSKQCACLQVLARTTTRAQQTQWNNSIEIGLATKLQVALNFSYNFLEGNIPTTLSSFRTFEVLDLSNNRLIGQIPESLIGALVALGAVPLLVVACKCFQCKHELLEVQEFPTVEGHFIHPDSIHRTSIDFEKGVEGTLDLANFVLKNKLSTYYKVVMLHPSAPLGLLGALRRTKGVSRRTQGASGGTLDPTPTPLGCSALELTHLPRVLGTYSIIKSYNHSKGNIVIYWHTITMLLYIGASTWQLLLRTTAFIAISTSHTLLPAREHYAFNKVFTYSKFLIVEFSFRVVYEKNTETQSDPEFMGVVIKLVIISSRANTNTLQTALKKPEEKGEDNFDGKSPWLIDSNQGKTLTFHFRKMTVNCEKLVTITKKWSDDLKTKEPKRSEQAIEKMDPNCSAPNLSLLCGFCCAKKCVAQDENKDRTHLFAASP
eukprot:Gb_10632 [translate_table: standard]